MIPNIIKNIIRYKPKVDKAFELLEKENEGDKQNSQNYNMNGQDVDGKMSNTQIDNRKEDNITMVSSNINDNIAAIKREFSLDNNSDILMREFKIARNTKAFIIYVDSMVDNLFVSKFIILPLMNLQNFQEYFASENNISIVDYISDNVISANRVCKTSNFSEIILEILGGTTALFIDRCNQCLYINTRSVEKRSIEKPATESVIIGAQEGFTENLRTNISLIRKIIKNPKLKSEMLKVGKVNHIYCALMYIDDLVNKDVLNEAIRRIKNIDVDFVLGSGMLSQFIEDSPYMLFPQILNTERPDRTASLIVEGKIAIFTDGTPFADIIPVTFFHLMQTSEDSMLRWQYSTFLRLIRLIGVFVSVFLPALYIALILFHEEAIPTELLASIALSKEEVPFPTLLEMIMLEIAFELIREGAIRVPGVIGQTLGIVGALILGQAAVSARLVSPIIIIIVSVTGIGSFALPNYSLGISLRILRFIFIFLAAILGFYGICGGLFILGILCCSVKSFGVPFFAPMAPKTLSNPDLFFRGPVWKQNIRPDYLNVKNRNRQRRTNKGSGNQ